MSILRITGLVLALLILGIVFFRLRRYSNSRIDVALLTIFGLSLLLITIFPGLVNIPAEILSLDKHERGRLLTLLILSNIGIWLLFLYERNKNKIVLQSFDSLVRSLAVEKFIKNYGTDYPSGILIIIPAFNEEDNLRKVLPEIPGKIENNDVMTLVIDDGSIDKTSEVCEERSIPVVRSLINRGGGAALRVGFEISKEINPRVIVTMDGDGQHRPEDIPVLIRPILQNEADLVIGSRQLGEMERYSTLRHWGVVLFGKVLSVLLGQAITDPASGFRAFNSNVLKKCVLTQDQYHTAEMIIEASKHDLRIQEEPIVIKRRISGVSKKGKNLKYALYFLRTILKTWMR